MSVNLSLFAGAGAQFFDDNGVPLAGGLIYTYSAGSTSPLTTYTSSSGTIPLTNPIVLNAAGRVPTGEIWLTAGVNYKFVVYTSTNVLVASYDNINGTYIATDLADTNNPANGDALVGFRQSNSSGNLPWAVGSTVHKKLQEFISVLDFGADSTGATSSLTAFQNAINATSNSGVQAIIVPTGTYLGDMTALSYGARTGFVWQEQGGVSYLTAAPASNSASLVVTRTTTNYNGVPATIGQVAFQYSPLGVSAENSAVAITKNSAYTAGTASNPSALLVTTNITANGGTKDNAIISIINDTSSSNSGKSRTAMMASGFKKSLNGSNFITTNFTAYDSTTRKSSVATGALLACEMDVAASGPDDVTLGTRYGLQVLGWEYAPSSDGATTLGGGVRVSNVPSNGTGNATFNYGFLVAPQPNTISPNPEGVTNAFAVNGNSGGGGGDIVNLMQTRGISGPNIFDLATNATTGNIIQMQGAANNSVSAAVNFGQFNLVVVSNTSGSESSKWQIQTKIAGTLTNAMQVQAGVYLGNPTGGDKGLGTLNVATGIYLNGTAYGNPDYVFEKAYTGQIVKFADKLGADTYVSRTIEEAEQYTKDNLALPGFGQDHGLDYLGGAEMLLARIEEAYLYIFQLNERIKILEKS
jgi:hypothetical protein